MHGGASPRGLPHTHTALLLGAPALAPSPCLDHSRAHAREQHHQLGNLPKHSSYQVTGKSLLLLMLLMENFSPFSAAFKASLVSHRLLSRAETAELQARREGHKAGREQVMRNRGGSCFCLPPRQPPLPQAEPGSSPYLPHLTAPPPPPPQGSCPAPQEAHRMHSEAWGRYPKGLMGQNYLHADFSPACLLPRKEPERLHPASADAGSQDCCLSPLHTFLLLQYH